MSKESPLQSMVIVIGPCWTNFCSPKLKGGFWQHLVQQDGATRHPAKATLDVLRPVFEDRFISSRADVVWPPRCCDLIPLHYYLWDAVKDKCYADKLETIDALKDKIRGAVGEIQLHTIVNALKNWLLLGQSRQPFEWNYFPLLTGKIILSNKKRNLGKYSVVFV